MAVSAYVLIHAEVGKAAHVSEEVSALDGVVSADSVAGPYEVIARVEAESVDQLGKMVAGGIQGIDGVTRTVTCLVVNL